MSDEAKGAVHVYVDDPTHSAFLAYSREFGWQNKIALPNLLVAREFKLRRLCGDVAGLGAAPSGRQKITVYLGRDRKLQLERHAAPLTPSDALSRLIRLELSERWLSSALSWSVT